MRRVKRRVRTTFVALSLLVLAEPACATWSIVAVDPETHEVGVAGASCITGAELVAKLVPGRGAVAAQAIPNLAGRDQIAAALARGESAVAALERVTSPDFDSIAGVPTVRLRQYGVVALESASSPANYTGTWTVGWAGSKRANGVTVQGNMLKGPEVVDDALAAFQATTPGCKRSLADRLMAGLEAGARAGGDRRCSPELAALSAFLQVASPSDDPERPSLKLLSHRPGAALHNPWSDFRRSLMITQEPGTRAESPVLLLRQQYTELRKGEGNCR